MAKITFKQIDGSSRTVEAGDGTLMELALDNGIDGIEGNCGGVCSCSTCHVYIPQEWMDRVGPATNIEQDTLEFSENAKSSSRLSCQIEVSDALNGLVVEVAPHE